MLLVERVKNTEERVPRKLEGREGQEAHERMRQPGQVTVLYSKMSALFDQVAWISTIYLVRRIEKKKVRV